MKKKLFIYGLCMMLFLSNLHALNQDVKPEPETIYLLTDRDYYITGEKIWFEAFVQSPETNLGTSKILYVEVFNEVNSNIFQQKFSINNGISTGYIQLPDHLYSGNYIIRAYSLYQRNFNPLQYCYSMFTLINPNQPLTMPKHKNLGFEMVTESAGTENAIACVAYVGEQNVAKEAVNAWITTTDSNVVLEGIHIDECGLASFKLEKLPSSLCFFNMETATQDTIRESFRLESFSQPGLIINQTDQYMRLSYNSEKHGNSPLHVNIYDSRGKISSENIQFSASNANVQRIEKDQFTDGPMLITIADDDGVTIAETLVYNYPALHPEVNIVANLTANVQQVSMNVDLNKFPDVNQTNVRMVHEVSLYSSDEIVRSVLYNPALIRNTIFTKDLKKTQLDLLLKLRRNEIVNALKESETVSHRIKFCPESKDVTLRALARNKHSLKPVAKVPVYLSVLGHGGYFIPEVSNSLGELSYTLYNLEGEQRIFLTVPSEFKDSVEVLIQNDFANGQIPFQIPPLRLKPSDKSFIEQLMIAAQISDMVNNISMKQIKQPQLPGTFYGEPESHVRLKDFIELPNLEEVFHEIVMNAAVRKKKNEPYFVLYEHNNMYSYESPLVLLDNVPVFNNAEVLKIPPSKVESIDVVNSVYIVGTEVFRGIIGIKTYASDFGGYTFPDEVVYVKYLTSTTHAYPELKKISNEEYRKPDFRNLIFWETAVTNESITIDLPDNQGNLKILLRGVDKSGEIIKGEHSLKFKKESHQDVSCFPNHKSVPW